MITKEELLQKYHISEDEFIAADISWEDLTYIYQDYESKVNQYKEIRDQFQTLYLTELNEVKIHSMRTRVKDPEHLLAKIIRNRTKHGRKYKVLTKDNYEKVLTDLIGFRCLILFKSQWIFFHKYIITKIQNDPACYVKDCIRDFDENKDHYYHAEPPKVHIRNGDSREIYERYEDVLPKGNIFSDKYYRSIHYIIKYQGVYLEIQLRTLFEEAWGEIDHSIVYPDYVDMPFMKQYTAMLNRVSGLADEMGSFFQELQQLPMEDMLLLGDIREENVNSKKDANVTAAIPDGFSDSQRATPGEIIHEVLQE